MGLAPLLPRVALLAALLVALLVGCSKQEEPPAPTPGEPAKVPLTLALNWVPEPEFGGFYAGKQGGAYAKEGIELTIQGGGAGVPVVQMVATGKVDFGIAGADEVLSARARGADVVALYAVFQKSPQGIMAHASRGAKSLADVFASGTLAIEPGLPYAAFLKKKYGFDKLKVVPYDGGVARFLADPEFAQQCFVTSEPIAAKKQGGDPQVFLVADEGFDPYLAVVIARRAFVTEKKDLARALRAGHAGRLEGLPRRPQARQRADGAPQPLHGCRGVRRRLRGPAPADRDRRDEGPRPGRDDQGALAGPRRRAPRARPAAPGRPPRGRPRTPRLTHHHVLLSCQSLFALRGHLKMLLKITCDKDTVIP